MAESNVLVVEDDDTIRQLLMEYLRSHAYAAVDAARDGVEALHQLSTKPYTVVVLDIMMPKMSGVDLLDSLVALSHDPSVKSLDMLPAVLVMTSAPEREVPDAVLTQKFPDVVRGIFRKPLELQALAQEVEKYVRA
jgi:CheY-like chemotaxis protein